MLGDFVKIEVGVLLKVERGFWTSGEETQSGLKCKVYLPKGKILEVRYPYEWHFRTVENHYDHASTETLTRKCSFFGKIHDDVRFNNKHKLKEILEQELYHKPSDFELTLR